MHGTHKSIDDARREAYSMRLEDIDVSRPELFRSNAMWPYFERLRKEAPVHYCPLSRVGPYWSVTRYKDIMHVETNHAIFSSDIQLGGIGIQNVKADYRRDSFIAMDEPLHSEQRKSMQPLFTPPELAKMAVQERAEQLALAEVDWAWHREQLTRWQAHLTEAHAASRLPERAPWEEVDRFLVELRLSEFSSR